MSVDAAALAGTLHVRPGGPLPTIRSTRREWAPRLGRGHSAERLPERLSMWFTLCGGAHRVAAGHAVAMARQPQGQAAEPDDGQRDLLRADTLREHLRRLWLDAPRAVAHLPPPDPAQLAGCPLMQRADAVEASRPWIETHVLAGDASRWLDGWAADPADHAARWAAGGATWPARWLAAVRERGGALQQRVVALAAQASVGEMQELAARLGGDEGFALAPTWRGQTAETGCWTRLADPHAQGPHSLFAPIWMRHAARVAEVARLAAPGGERWLAQGGLALGGGEGIGWCEMARGLLVHWVRIDDGGRVLDNRLIAPTEWNFHPCGPAARALAMLPSQAGPALVRLLVAAYDPCVAVEIDVETDPDHA